VELTARVFELKLLDILGYRPSLTECVVGNHQLSSAAREGMQKVWFSIERGGVVCPICAKNCEGAPFLFSGYTRSHGLFSPFSLRASH